MHTDVTLTTEQQKDVERHRSFNIKAVHLLADYHLSEVADHGRDGIEGPLLGYQSREPPEGDGPPAYGSATFFTMGERAVATAERAAAEREAAERAAVEQTAAERVAAEEGPAQRRSSRTPAPSRRQLESLSTGEGGARSKVQGWRLGSPPQLNFESGKGGSEEKQLRADEVRAPPLTAPCKPQAPPLRAHPKPQCAPHQQPPSHSTPKPQRNHSECFH